MPYTPGQDVEVKVGGSLGRWAPGTVVKAPDGCCGLRAVYLVQVEGRNAEVGERQLRRPRKVQVSGRPIVKKSTKRRSDVVQVGRGPLRFPEYRKWVKTMPCLFCFAKVVDPHHYGSKGLGQTTDDTRLTPVCRQAHDALHHRRVDELCAPTAYLRNDPEHAWAIVEAHVFQRQGDILATFIRIHGGLK